MAHTDFLGYGEPRPLNNLETSSLVEPGPGVIPLDPKWHSLLEKEWIELLDHSAFLRRCRERTVSVSELKGFVIQQHYYSKHFTRYLCALLSNISNEGDRLLLTENLLEEIGFGSNETLPHSQIYRNMMRRMGVDSTFEPVLPSTQSLIDAMYEACHNRSPLVGLSALCLGAEAIVPHIYSQVLEGFLSHKELSQNLDFFQIHIQDDDKHALTMQKIIERELKQDPFQLHLLRLSAVRLLQARTQFFEGIFEHYGKETL